MSNAIDMVEVGKKLRELRGVRTRTGVARELGISYSGLSFYENGQRCPSDATKKKLAEYYGVTVDSIFG